MQLLHVVERISHVQPPPPLLPRPQAPEAKAKAAAEATVRFCNATSLDFSLVNDIPHFPCISLRFAFTSACRLIATYMTPPPVSRAGTPPSSPWAATSVSAATATKRRPGRLVATLLPSSTTRPFPYPAARFEPSPNMTGASTPWPSLLLHCLCNRKRFSLFATTRRVTHSCAQCR